MRPAYHGRACNVCGIFGCLSERYDAHAEWISDALHEMRHRGPDGWGIWVSPNRSVGLGHVRLALVGIQSGAQPIHSEDGLVHAVVNGEFYGHEGIRRELEAGGHRFTTRTDSEIAIHLYEELGVEFVEQLRGEFSLVLWDERSGALVAVRDRFGIKPLYYAKHKGRLLFASEVKGLLAAGVPAVWDRHSVFQHLHMCLANDRTVFKGIRQVPPGHFLLARRGSWEIKEYWDMDFPPAGTRSNLSENEAIDILKAQLVEATTLRLQADVPVGIYLSGGIDSCGLLGIAAAISDRAPHAFTVRFPEDGFDEGDLAELATRHVGAVHHVLDVTERDRADHFRDALWHSELPTGGSNLVGKYLLSRLVRSRGIKAVITGEGADELFGGYSFFRCDVARSHSYSAGREGEKIAEDIGGEFPLHAHDNAFSVEAAGAEELLLHTPASLLRVPARGALVAPFLSADFREEFLNVDPIASLLGELELERIRRWEQLNQSLYVCAKTSLATNLLNRLGDRSEMAHSIEGRTPFLDHRLVEAVSAFPVHYKVNEACEKYALREAVRSLVPDKIYRRTKQPFLASSDISGCFGEMVSDTLSGRELDSLPFFEPQRVRRAMERARRNAETKQSGEGSFLTHVASLCLLQNLFGLRG